MGSGSDYSAHLRVVQFINKTAQTANLMGEHSVRLILISCSVSEIFEFAAIHSPESSNGFPYAYYGKFLEISIHL